MKKFDKKFIGYSITLFIVSVLLISIGAVSLTRNSEIENRSRSSAQNRIELLGNENINLKAEIEKVKKENAELSAKIAKSENGGKDAELIFEVYNLVESKDYKNALKKLEKIDKKLLSEQALKTYEKLSEIVKENIEND